MIDKGCHSQTPNFKLRQQRNVGLVSSKSELIRRTLLCCQTKSPQLEQWSGTLVGVCCSSSSVKAEFVQGYLKLTELQSGSCH